eukprot:m.373536 g.373536  ORF g.373536 m.373536 type:complete len:792 (-) comp16690_c0_seq26:7356-9731(-)
MDPEDPVVSYGVGEQVQAEFDGEGWLTGTVTRVFGDGTLEVTFEDGYVDRFSAATTTDELRRPRESEDGDAWPESSSSAGKTFSHRITLQRKVAEGAISPLERDWIAQIEAQLEADSVLEQKVAANVISPSEREHIARVSAAATADVYSGLCDDARVDGVRKSLGTLPEGISEAVGVSTATSCSDPESSVEQPCESNSSESNDTPTHDPAKDDCKLCGSAAAGRWVYMRNCTCAFHGKCLETWRLDGHNLCPQCDVPISATLFYADFLGEHVTTEVGVVGCECEKQVLPEAIRTGRAEASRRRPRASGIKVNSAYIQVDAEPNEKNEVFAVRQPVADVLRIDWLKDRGMSITLGPDSSNSTQKPVVFGSDGAGEEAKNSAAGQHTILFFSMPTDAEGARLFYGVSTQLKKSPSWAGVAGEWDLVDWAQRLSVHVALTKREAENLLAGERDGVYLVRSNFPYDWESTDSCRLVLSVVYNRKATHHSLVKSEIGGEFKLGKELTGFTSLKEVLIYYREARPKWPVALTYLVPVRVGVQPLDKPSALVPIEEPAVHVGISKADAEKLLAFATDGVHLVRTRDESTPQTKFILSVVYKGKPTHHPLVRPSEGEMFTLNKLPTGHNTLGGVLAQYREVQHKWPVPLTVLIPPLPTSTSETTTTSSDPRTSDPSTAQQLPPQLDGPFSEVHTDQSRDNKPGDPESSSCPLTLDTPQMPAEISSQVTVAESNETADEQSPVAEFGASETPAEVTSRVDRPGDETTDVPVETGEQSGTNAAVGVNGETKPLINSNGVES